MYFFLVLLITATVNEYGFTIGSSRYAQDDAVGQDTFLVLKELFSMISQPHKTTPLMQQYWEIKREYPDALLFIQVGDFFELFFEDAKTASAFLGIALTKRGKDKGEDIPLCGVPVHALDHYLAKLVKGGFCVVLCEQLEQAVPGKMVRRGVTRVLTPGTLTDSNLLNDRRASYLLTFAPYEDRWALVFAELMTAQLYATSLSAGAMKSLETELARFFPDEIILPGSQDEPVAKTFQALFQKQGYFTSVHAPDPAMLDWAKVHLQEAVVEQVQANKSLERALATLYAYFKKNNEAALQEFSQLHFYEPEDFMVLDAASQRNLELIKNNQDGTTINSLVSVLDETVTAMGSRMLKKWLVRPLVNKQMIEHRLDAVGYLKEQSRQRTAMRQVLQTVGDVERVIGRIALGRAKVDDYVHLQRALSVVPELKERYHQLPQLLQTVVYYSNDFGTLAAFLASAFNDDSTKEWIIKAGFDERLDRVRGLLVNSAQAIEQLERKEQEATGISSLKIRYTNVFGYYLEVTNVHAAKVPAHYKRQQTLVGKERYMSPELQELQQEIISARSEAENLEKQLFSQVQNTVRPYVGTLRKMAHALAQLDLLGSFAEVAYQRGYSRPMMHEGRDIRIKAGKHPVVAKRVGAQFIPNDTELTDEQSLWVITGPNMGGKSTYLRQTALIAIMAQCGSFVSAGQAELPLIDAIFTRIGASDNVAEGKSTFLVEMEETAHICRYATERSLVILDEVGRGTSTFDGVALAQAVVEYIITKVKARSLFATHYHELTLLQGTIPGIVNYHLASKKTTSGIIFLHTIIRGAAEGSFGLAVAKLAEMPDAIIARAHEVMKSLSLPTGTIIPAVSAYDPEKEQLRAELQVMRKKIDQLQAINYDDLSPKKAFDFLWQLRKSEY